MAGKPRASKAKQQCKLICCTTSPEALERIRSDLERWEPGKWARENSYGPACVCGLRPDCARHPADD